MWAAQPGALEKAMATHSSTLSWKIPWMEEPGRLQSMGSWTVGHDWAASLSLFYFHALEKEMATHSSVLAWRIPGMGEPGGLPSMGSHRVTHDWSDLAAAARGPSVSYLRWLLGWAETDFLDWVLPRKFPSRENVFNHHHHHQQQQQQMRSPFLTQH